MNTSTAETLSPTDLNKTSRIESLDILRGLIMVLMAIDHVRVYSGVPPGGPEAGVFFTRWVTHFCAPGFAFFAGTSAFLYGNKVNSPKALATFLFTRGLLLVVLELTVIRFFWTFNLNLSAFILAGVIWMLGWCMMLLAAMVSLRPKTVGVIGMTIILAQQAFRFVPQVIPESFRANFARVWEFVYPSGFGTFEGFSVLYSIVPWIGVMAAGYGFGAILLMNPRQRKRLCLAIGLSAIGLYIIVGTIVILMNPSPEAPPFWFRLLNQSKYPASQIYLMMTLGPMILAIPYLERAKGWLVNVLNVFGRVPFFYYLLHILLIHLSALAVQAIRDGGLHQEWFTYAPYAQVPAEFRWSLPLLYLIFLLDVVLLYFVCRWYSRYKASHPEIKWLRFL